MPNNKSVTFWLIRSIKEFEGYNNCYPIGSYENIYSFKKGWYAAREYVKPFKYAKFFATEQLASKYLKQSRTLPHYNRNEYFEIIPIEISEPTCETTHNDNQKHLLRNTLD